MGRAREVVGLGHRGDLGFFSASNGSYAEFGTEEKCNFLYYCSKIHVTEFITLTVYKCVFQWY